MPAVTGSRADLYLTLAIAMHNCCFCRHRVQKLVPVLEAFDGRKYSMSELMSINDGTMVVRLNDTIKELVAHVLQCRVRARPLGPKTS